MPLRHLSDVDAANDRAWFGPALDRIRSLRDASDARLREWLIPDAPVFVGRAPGRLDVMGGIADYSGALVLELPLARATWAAVQRQSEPRCDIMTLRDGAWHTFSTPISPLVVGELREAQQLGKWFAERGGDRWPAYVVGVVQRCLQRAGVGGDAGGFRLLVESNVPEGKGVASSAALEVAVMSAVAAACGDDIAPTELATECQWVENHVVGAPCGIMDQMTSACGRQQRLLRLRCQPGTIEGYVDVPEGYRFYGIDSGVRHAVSGDDYSTVRTAAFMGYRMIAEVAGLRVEQRGTCVRIDDPRWHGYLANLTPEEFSAEYEAHLPEQLSGDVFLQRYGGITDTVTRVRPDICYRVRQATAHPIHEQRRVEKFARLLDRLSENSDIAEELGRLMYASHASYSACGLGSDGTDLLVEMVAELGAAQGLFGAKITGGGSGGTVAILGTDRSGSVVSEIARRYQQETGRRAEVFDASGPGAAETGVLVLSPQETM
jgi:L-arabinokinase